MAHGGITTRRCAVYGRAAPADRYWACSAVQSSRSCTAHRHGHGRAGNLPAQLESRCAMNNLLAAQTSQLLTHLLRGGNYSHFCAASHAKNERDEAFWKATTWINGTVPKEAPADHHAIHGPVHLYFGVHPTKEIPKERK